MVEKPKKVTKKELAREIAALKLEVATLKSDVAHLRVEQKTNLKSEIDGLHKKLAAELAQAKEKSKREEKDIKASVKDLKEKALKAKDEAKTVVEARVKSLREKPKAPATTTSSATATPESSSP